MVATIRLTVITGPHKNQRFCFRGPTQCTLGRASDCFVRLAGDGRDQLISRHHCEIHVDPPCVRIADLGSSNGTYLNGRKVSELEQSVIDVLTGDGVDAASVSDGDVITVGGTSLRADIVECPPPHLAVEHVWAAGETAKDRCDVKC